MESHFAPPERSSQERVRAQAAFVANNQILNTILSSAQGLLAILNSDRQIVAINDTLKQALNLSDAEVALGLRPGEAVRCVHSADMPGGCGTSEFCRSCGAVISIVSALDKGSPVEDRCIITAGTGADRRDIAFSVRACPVTLEGETYVLLFMRDVSDEERRAALERAFFHDVGNIVNGLTLMSQLMAEQCPSEDKELLKDMDILVRQLRAEIEIQRALSTRSADSISLRLRTLKAAEVLEHVRGLVEHHPSASGKTLLMEDLTGSRAFRSDFMLVSRVILNMVLNALEAAEKGQEVRLRAEHGDRHTVFSVWNRQHIEPLMAMRVFQHQFSTKGGKGRGLGTYSMKLLGEQILGGKVDFKTSPEEGTTFYLRLPYISAEQ